MSVEEKICPYPGLRPFNDEESIFFKGRDRNIDTIIELFEKKKFMMVTGASGDGKSSLIYAGVVPHARGGLFKAKYNNWAVADFRPEREPLQNLSKALQPHLKLKNETNLTKELSYGFSSLINLYKNSDLYLNPQSETWLKANDAEKKVLKRKAGNLLIIADQFEEFFTNIENYHNGIASVESQTVVNLLLETAKIALAEDLPIYVICTMRSDYIGQCAAFRGLPEYIGFSQFFVPRLKRNEIQQVIEQPALLNGDKISRRLSERLLNDITDGYDQLPILQHALNQIWKAAANGSEEMDLIHYAKVGGFDKHQLPETDLHTFENWFNTLPEFKKTLFEKPSLENILNAHSNELYETAFDAYVKNKSGQHARLTADDSKYIIKTAFQCLTKIDEARAVRNRMTLDEITQVINHTGISTNVVASVLHLFRLQGNTFLRPFINEHDETQSLVPEQVLDITHESLIRNWDLLGNWAKEEYENLQNFLDFKKQLQRWSDGGKSKGYLLPIGPLTFFETWYNKANPNKYWLARYDDSDLSKEEKLNKAEQILRDAHEFLKKSAARLFFTRTVMKYGADRIIAAFGIVMLLISCTYFYFDFRTKQNEYVVEEIKQNGDQLLESKNISPHLKARYILSRELLNSGVYNNLLKKVGNDSITNKVLFEMLMGVLSNYNTKNCTQVQSNLCNELYNSYLQFCVKQIENGFSSKNPGLFTMQAKNVVSLVTFHENLKYTKHVFSNSEAYTQFANLVFKQFKKLISDTSFHNQDPKAFNALMQSIPAIVHYNSDEISKIIASLNPFELHSSTQFNRIFDRTKKQDFDYRTELNCNGGYFEIGCYFALSGNIQGLVQCLDTLLKHNPTFIRTTDIYEHFFYCLIHSKKLAGLEGIELSNKIQDNLNIHHEFPMCLRTLSKTLLESSHNTWQLERLWQKNFQPASLLRYGDDISTSQLEEYANLLIQKNFYFNTSQKIISVFDKNGNESTIISNSANPNTINYYKAFTHKTLAFLNNQHYAFDLTKINFHLNSTFNYYNKIDRNYLNEEISIGSNDEIISIKRSGIIKSPVYLNLTQGNKWAYSNAYFHFKKKDIVLDFILNKKTFENDYLKNKEDIALISDYFSFNPIEFYNDTSIIENYSKYLWLCLNSEEVKAKLNKNFALGIMALDSYRRHEYAAFYRSLSRIDFKDLLSKNNVKNSDEVYRKEELVSTLAGISATCIKNKNFKELDSSFYAIIKKCTGAMPNDYSRRNLYLSLIDSLQNQKKDLYALKLLDEFFSSELKNVTRFGNKLFEILGKNSTGPSDRLAVSLMKDKSDTDKPMAMELYIKGKAKAGDYYNTLQKIPEYFSSSTQIKLYRRILLVEFQRKNKNLQLFPGNSFDSEWSMNPYEQDSQGYIFISTEE